MKCFYRNREMRDQIFKSVSYLYHPYRPDDGPVVIELDAGDAVLFRYDVRHGGAAYTSQHIRLHEYWEPIGAGDIEFRVGVHFGREGGNQLHAMETGASWNKKSAASNPGKVYRGATFAYDDVAKADTLIPGL